MNRLISQPLLKTGGAACMELSLNSPGGVAVELLQPRDYSGWDAFVAATAQASFFHQTGWIKAVEDHYGHRSCSLVAREEGQIRGVLPLFLVSGPMTGRALISTPYAVTGGCVSTSSTAQHALIAGAKRHATDLGVRYLELRGLTDLAEEFTTRDHYYAFRTTLPDDPALVLARFPRKARAEIRKAQNQFQLTAEIGPELFDLFYSLYVRSLRRLGSPAHSSRFLRRLLTEFGENCLVQIVRQGDQPVAGVLSFRFRDQILPYFAGIDDRFNHLNSSNFLYFSLMQHAVSLGLRIFDFGRTRRDNLGGCQFKINQGFEPELLVYSYYNLGGGEAPDLRPSNAAFSWPQQVWRRLPLPVAGHLGGLVTRWFP